MEMLEGCEDEEREEDGGKYQTQAEDSGERGYLTSAAPEGVRTGRGGFGGIVFVVFEEDVLLCGG